MRQAFADTMYEIGLEDERLVVLVGDISHNVLQPFAQACPGRYYNVGIMEPTIVGMAAGLAISGLKPVVHTIAPFLIERSFEQIKLDFGYQELNGTFISVGGAFDYSGLGCSHHTYADCALMKSIPKSVVICPASRSEFKQLFVQAHGKHLAYFRLSEKHGSSLGEVELGKAVRVKVGDLVTIVAVGPQLKTALDANILGAEIIYVHTLKPLDIGCIGRSVSKTGRCVVLEEHSEVGSVADEIRRAGCLVENICIPDEFQRGYGTRQDHLNKMGLTVEALRSACR